MAVSQDMRVGASVCALVGGVLIIAGSLMGVVMMSSFGIYGGMGGWMMGGYAPTSLLGAGVWMGAWGLATGAVVVVGALRLRDPATPVTGWGVAVVSAGALSLLAMGGFVIGAVLAILGGALALTGAGPRVSPAEGP